MTHTDLQLRPSEEATLSARGYQLLKKLGEGSYARVYLAEFKLKGSDDKQKTRKLACKIIDSGKAPKDFVKKFLPRELAILVRLNHPHIIHIHSIFQRKTKYYIFMRHAELGDMLEFILKKGPISEAQSRVWMKQLALALQYLHSMEIAHRDLKCENCLITSNYNMKVGDFGFARYVIDENGRKVSSATYCGSLSYAAPEILRGTPYYPKISDLWSTGVILYVMLNKAMPFDDTNVKRLHEQQINKKWKFRAKVVESLSVDVKSMVGYLLEPDTTKRYRAVNILNSSWIAQDPRLVKMTSAEELAQNQATATRKSLVKQLRRDFERGNKGEAFAEKEDVKVYKNNDATELKPEYVEESAMILNDAA